MAAEMVLLENLERTLDSLEKTAPSPLKRQLNRLRGSVSSSHGAVIALERGDYVHDALMRVRLEKLSTSLHDVDDLLDQIMTFKNRSKRFGEVSFLLLLPLPFFFTRSMARRVEKTCNYIETLVGQLLIELENTNQPSQRQLRPIGLFIPAEHIVIGRSNDKKNIANVLLQTPEGRISTESVSVMSRLAAVMSRLAAMGKSALTRNLYEDRHVKSLYDHRMLFQTPEDTISNVSVIWMSGVAGVGKSALAKDIYEDPDVMSHFDLRMWIPVSKITDETDIIRKIVESCTNSRSNYRDSSRVHQNDVNSFQHLLGCRGSSVATGAHSNNNEIDIYERQLKNEIRGKRYILILDDFCLHKWQRLRDLLAGGAEGSQILVTSRLVKVADLVNDETTEIIDYPLQGLANEHSWTLFSRLAFKQGGTFYAETKNMGFQITDLCKHLPFTVKVAASFINGKDMGEWSAFKEELRLINDQREDVMEHVLHLSLSELPPHLRACFGYCSLFPDDFTFNKHDLISHWIAQGFVYPHDGLSLAEVGEMYLKELSRRCLFEKESTDDLGNILTCKMHHIVRGLALKLTAGVANKQETDYWIQVADPTLKHVFVNYRGDLPLELSSPLFRVPSVRTLILAKEPDGDIKVDTLVCNQLISSYNRLRVLDLHDLGLKELPYSIGEQIHLRYLDLSKNDGLVTLPKSLTRLHNLQTLKLTSCRKLKMVGYDFGLLVNLQRFEVDKCDRLTRMPLGLEKLTQLETLSQFVVGKGSSKQAACSGLEALSGMMMLRGRLVIKFTGDWIPNIPVDNPAEAAVGWVENKAKLRELDIRWAKKIPDVKYTSEEDIFNQGKLILAQEKILEHLQPNSSLESLTVEGYKGGHFPSWARADTLATSLPNLVILTIEGCDKCEFLPPFRELLNLKILILRHMTNVRYIEEPAQGGNEGSQDRPFFKSLEELTLHNFYKLEGWWKEVARIQQRETRTFPCVSRLRIWNSPSLRSLPSFPKVIELKLRNVHQFLLDDGARKASNHKNRFGGESSQSKHGLNLEGLGGLPSLKHLVIEKFDALRSLASDLENITSLEKLKISSCKELDLSQESHAAYNLLRSSSWKKLKCLRELSLADIPKMEILPEGLQHVKTLKMLRVSACQSLGSLPEWISCLTALQHLQIESCSSLKRLPQELENVKSLLKVEITDCPDLMERCQGPDGEDWPYIKHARVLLHKSWRYGYVS